MLKICLETSALNFNQAGTARVAGALSQAMAGLAEDDLSFLPIPPLPNLKVTSAGLARKLFVLYWESLYVPYLLPWRVRGLGADLVHCLAPLPLSTAIRREGVPIITTIYDVISFTHPQWFTPVMRHRLCRWTERSAKFSDHFMAISGFTRDTFCQSLSVPVDRVTVTYLGGLEDTLAAEDGPRSEPYMLAVGTLEPRKNLHAVLEAYVLLKDHLANLPRLLVAGGQGWGGVQVAAYIDRLELRGQVEILGFVSDAQLAGLYQRAKMLIYPSLQEGFGLPALEAMGLGCPVITSNGSALPEVVGEAALLVNPNEPSELAEAMERMLTDQALAGRLRQKGFQQAAQFSWHKCADETVRVYRALLGSRRGANPQA